jgi:hypothetical protein
MKKVRILVLALLLALTLVSSVFAVDGTATITRNDIWVSNTLQRKVLFIAIVGGTSGAFTDATINAATYGVTGWYLYSASIIAGSPAPNDGYGIALKDIDGVDLTQSLLSFLSNAGSWLVNIGNGGFWYPVVRSNLTLSITGMGVSSCQTKLVLVFVSQRGF